MLLLVFITRVLFLSLPTIRSATSDTNFHIWFSNTFFKTNKSLSHKKYPGSIVDGKIVYPPIPHIFLSFVKKKYICFVGAFLNILFDYFSAVVCYWVVVIYLNELPMGIDGQILSRPFISSILFATTPLLHPVNARLTGIGGRTIGPFLILVYFCFLGNVLIYDELFYVVFLGPIALLIILSSQFALQVLLFFSAFLTLFYMDILPLGLALVVVFLSFKFNIFGTREQLVGKIQHLKWYLDKNANPKPLNRNTLDVLLAVLGFSKNPGRACMLLFKRVTPFILAYSLPCFWALVYIFWTKSFHSFQGGQTIELYFCLMITISFIVFVLTSFRPLIILGEAERYVEYTVPFMCFVLVFFAAYSGVDWILPYVVIVNVLFVILNYMILSEDIIRLNLKTESLQLFDDQLIKFLSSISGLRCVTIPLKLSYSLSSSLSSEHKFYFPAIFTEKDGLLYTLEDCVVYDKIKPAISKLSNKYNLNYLVVENNYYRNTYIPDCGPVEHDCLIKIFSNDKYSVFEIVAT
ncbi:hypothetical protein SAMN02745165_00782 [Malonomonas rubra DSM 5091]|uniref:Glucosyl transferase GtrII n=1 Tax=Malonomonas rubra DSM 5091 TaxID=1122189 RepID=A0A1M6DRF5_MALRU|nr:hypothetical protein SAMN02745165_00782 [Malonomonas rubra DSM 5091]